MQKVGLYIGTQFPPGTDVAVALKDMGEQVRVARESSFSSLWVPHHFLTHLMQMLAPVPLSCCLLPDDSSLTIGLAAVVDAAVKRAAQLGDAWLITNFAHLNVLVPQMAMYRKLLTEAKKEFPTEAPITRECYIGSTHAKALEECKAALQYKYGAYSSWGLDKQSKGAESFEQPFEEFVKDRFIIGDKAFVKDEIQRYHALLGVNHFIMRVQWPGLEQAKALGTISALGEIFA